MTITIAVMGQSNSILHDGYAHAIDRLPGLSIAKRLSLGASPSILIPWFLADDTLDGCDIVLFDTAIIDQHYLWSQSIDVETLSGWLAHGLCEAHRAGAIPVVLNIPHRAIFEQPKANPQPTLLTQAYRTVCDLYGGLLLDPTPRIGTFLEEGGSLADIYKDPDHFSPDYSAEFAANIASVLERTLAEPRPSPLLPSRRKFRRVPIRTGAEPILRSNSLLAGLYSAIDHQETAIVETGPIARVSGIMINRCMTNGNILVWGDGRVVKGARGFQNFDGDYMAQMIPLRGQVADLDGVVGVRNVCSAPTEPSWVGHSLVPGLLEASELLVELLPEAQPADRPDTA